MGRARLTSSPAASSPSAVRASVSGPTSKPTQLPEISTAVRQTPLTARLEPTWVSLSVSPAPIMSRASLRRKTRPVSSTMPVNISAHPSRAPVVPVPVVFVPVVSVKDVGLHHPVGPELADGDDLGAHRFRQQQARASNGPGRSASTEERGRREGDHPVHEARLEESPREPAAAFHEGSAHFESTEPGDEIANLHPPLVRLAPEDGGAASFERVYALGLGGVRDRDQRPLG